MDVSSELLSFRFSHFDLLSFSDCQSHAPYASTIKRQSVLYRLDECPRRGRRGTCRMMSDASDDFLDATAAVMSRAAVDGTVLQGRVHGSVQKLD